MFQVELEYSLAFRLLIYRLEVASPNAANSTAQRAQCIGKFHRNVSEWSLIEREFLFSIIFRLKRHYEMVNEILMEFYPLNLHREI